MRMIVVLAVLGVLASSAPASAVDGTLTGASTIFVWRDVKAQDEGFALIKAGVHERNPAAVSRLIVCTVPRGTRATFMGGGLGHRDVLVTDGPHAGCRGTVPAGLWERR